MDRDLEERDMIFAQGRDGAFPHSRGNNAQPLKLGEAIVFDLFPFEQGGGYYHDMTRTWCIGYAPDEVREAHQQVLGALNVAIDSFAVGRNICEMQNAVQTYFEERKHPTLRSHPGTTTGYTHGLGHGVGLSVHEGYTISHFNKTDTFQVGNVITIEPGLYYPERGYGVRVEDTFYIQDGGGMLTNPKSQLVSLTDVPKDLILPLRG
jgi:Xaa-Pro aminopeptidase